MMKGQLSMLSLVQRSIINPKLGYKITAPPTATKVIRKEPHEKVEVREDSLLIALRIKKSCSQVVVLIMR